MSSKADTLTKNNRSYKLRSSGRRIVRIIRSPYFRENGNDNGSGSHDESHKVTRRREGIPRTRAEKQGKINKPRIIPAGSRGLHVLANYIPPKSPFNLVQESLFHDPWALLVCTVFLNRTSGKAAIPIFWKFLKQWPTAKDVAREDVKPLAELLQPLGLNVKRARIIKRFSEEFLHKDWLLASDLYGIGKYGNDSYRIFCLGDWKSVRPSDRKLNVYHRWLIEHEAKIGYEVVEE